MSDQLEQELAQVRANLDPVRQSWFDAVIAAVRADVFAQVEAEARRRAKAPWRGADAVIGLDGLADWCQQQKGQG